MWLRPLGWGLDDPLEICPSPTCFILPNLVDLRQAVPALLGDLPENLIRVSPFKTTQGHRNRHVRSIRHL